MHRYNHNLETARSFFARIVTTHTWEERFDTCRWCGPHGMELCCGVLLGMGETVAQRMELIGRAARRRAGEVPVNFLNPRPGTPLADQPLVAPIEAIRWIALLRIGLPDVILRYAGGREVTLRDLQVRGLHAGINALIVGNYLTTLGRSPEEDLQMLEDLRMPIGVLSQGDLTRARRRLLHRVRPAVDDCDGACRRELDPPRFCANCGRRSRCR